MSGAVIPETIRGGATVCSCHGWSVRRMTRRDGSAVSVHCEHPVRYVEPGDGYIPGYCEACGWNLGRYDRRAALTESETP